MAKTDIRSAFRNVPVHPNDWELLGMQWNGFYYFDKVLPFGLRSAPHIFNQLSDAVEWVMLNNYGVGNILHFLDDFFIAEAPPRGHCMTSLCKLLCLFADLDIPVAPKKTFPASTTLEFLGVLLDSVNMTASLPEDKHERIKIALSSWLQKKFCTLRELQSLIGTLQFACRVVVPGRPFLQRIIALTRGIAQPFHHIKLSESFRKDVAMWQIFLDHWNGCNFFLDTKIAQSPDLHFFTDASGRLGYGAFLNNHWFQGKWSLIHHSHKEQQSIAWKELFPIYLACMVWGPQWSGKRIMLWCDNQSVINILNSKSSKISKIMDLVRKITVQTLICNFTLTSQHVPGVDNSIADALSRFQMDKFFKLAPHASPRPTIIPESLIHI